MLNQEWIRETQITFFLAASGVELDCCLFLRRSLTDADGGCGAWLEDAGSPLSSIATGAIMLSSYGIKHRENVAMSPEIRRESRFLLSRPPRFNFSRLMAAIYPLPPRTPTLCTDEGKKRQSNRHASMDLPLARSTDSHSP